MNIIHWISLLLIKENILSSHNNMLKTRMSPSKQSLVVVVCRTLWRSYLIQSLDVSFYTPPLTNTRHVSHLGRCAHSSDDVNTTVAVDVSVTGVVKRNGRSVALTPRCVRRMQHCFCSTKKLITKFELCELLTFQRYRVRLLQDLDSSQHPRYLCDNSFERLVASIKVPLMKVMKVAPLATKARMLKD